ncbi:hypothetical protein [Hymenobacter cheonanensis]|uniref:hypothetical protein n=1 Tax=Hymenobacter sp. CA2-7 TaxID=3063993 RepID=UPI0027131902|nr:hypothetical protein [Hymenobacter sp. CA2-7]MDO7888292.1 hypothetical protein [Hymenobacter sp. CA2-7]
MDVALYSLSWARFNTQRTVSYQDSPRRIVSAAGPLDPDQPQRSPSGEPDDRPFADGELITTRYEGDETVTLYAQNGLPYARFEVAYTAPPAACDLAIPTTTPSADGFSFTVTTSHPPFTSSLTTDAGSFVAGKTTYSGLAPGSYPFFVRDALGCQQSGYVTIGTPAGSSTYPPPGAILLKRTVKPAFNGDPDRYITQEDWYDPATRTAGHYTIFDSLDGDPYSRPEAEVIDRWCVAPGVEPFTENQVHHNGRGGITLVAVDGVMACQYTCTLTLALSATSVHNGRADLTATASGAQGPIEFSLDNFLTPGLAPTPAAGNKYVFYGLRTGSYPVYVRETRLNGCTATATLTITAPYGPRYEHGFRDADNVACLLRIFEREYDGEPERITYAQPAPVVLDWPGGATDHLFTSLVRGSECQLALYMATRTQLLPLYSGDERLHRVEVSRAGQLLWKGYLLPEQYDVAFLTPPNTFSLSATDGLGTLSTVPFLGAAGQALQGDWTLLELLLFLLAKLDVDLPLHTLFHLYPQTATLASPALEQIRVDVSQYQDDKGKAWDCGKVLSAVLTTFQTRLYQWAGAWWLERLIELRPTALTYVSYSPTGTRLANASRVPLEPIVRFAAGRPAWQGSGQRQGLRPAVGHIAVAADPGELANYLRPVLPKNSEVPGQLPLGWLATADVPSELIYQGQEKTPLLRLAGSSGYTAATAPWVQTRSTFSLLPNKGDSNELVRLAFTVKPYGNTPTTTEADQPVLYVAVKMGSVWLWNYLAGKGPGLPPVDSPTPVQVPLRFADASEQELVLFFSTSTSQQSQPLAVRFYAPAGGLTPTTVDISELALGYESGSVQAAESYTTAYTTDTGQLVSRVDEDLALFHSDTPLARRAGTLLDARGFPTAGWVEPASPTLPLEAGDYVVTARNLWQQRPAQVLTGTLRGLAGGPGALLTDPGEARPAVYVLTAATYPLASAAWQLTGVQDLLLGVAEPAFPDHAIYNEDDSAWLTDSGTVLLYEDAN